jgi:hypothetical protein
VKLVAPAFLFGVNDRNKAARGFNFPGSVYFVNRGVTNDPVSSKGRLTRQKGDGNRVAPNVDGLKA